MIELRALSKADMEQVRIWRNEMPEGLRTPFDLTAEMQEDYYRDVICNRESHTRYWGIWAFIPAVEEVTDFGDSGPVYARVTAAEKRIFIGYGGIENIQWESRLGEISILIGPDFRRKGYGKQAVVAILARAFSRLNLDCVYGECYVCNEPGIAFWHRLIDAWDLESTLLPGYRKRWNGELWTARYFAIHAASWYNGVINAGNS